MELFDRGQRQWHIPSRPILALLLALLAVLSRAAPDDIQTDRDVQVVRRPPFAKFSALPPPPSATSSGTTIAASATSTPLECFQVAEPLLTPRAAAEPSSNEDPGGSSRACTLVLMEHSFANSYNAPFVANYTPPDCEFDHVAINFTVQVKGRQYDRTGVMYLGDTEVWRTTTAEPTPYGIRWVWRKDMTHYLALWKEPQILIFDLENIVNDIYTGILNTTLTATFFKSYVRTGHHAPADMVIPISERTGSVGEPSQFTYPEQNATNTIGFPRNVNRAVFSVSVKAQGDDEFWWTNVPQSAAHAFDADYGPYPGYSPWREVQVFIDGRLAGVSWPFPVVFTGGIVPQLHRPIVGIDAFDLREHEIDITPWLPLLCDGGSHTFTIRVVGLIDDGVSAASLSSTTENSWYITGKIFLWLDDKNSITTGTVAVVSQPEPDIAFSQVIRQNASNFNESLDYQLAVKRDFSVSAFVKTQRSQGLATWSQKLSYSNLGRVWAYGWNNSNIFDTNGVDAGESPGASYSTSYSYPAYCNSSVVSFPEGNLTIWAQFDQGLDLEVRGSAVFPTGLEAFEGSSQTFDGGVLRTQRNTTGDYYRPADNSYSTGHGSAHQVFYFGGFKGKEAPQTGGTMLYYRDVAAANDSVISDVEKVSA